MTLTTALERNNPPLPLFSDISLSWNRSGYSA